MNKQLDPMIGQQVGNYVIQHPLGRGGMARVYKGMDLTLKRPVAIKVIEEELRGTGAYTQRFEREAQAVANLKHPNIVNVYYFGNQEAMYYLVMEYIDGTNLDAVIRNYAHNGELMPHTDVVRILGAMASALDYAHKQGVIHRDIKPSNIMLEHDGRPILTDFGLALRVSEGSIGDTFGTPHYISPEQARNSANAVPQSDIYSLGIVAFELLTGSVPFDDPSPTALAMQHIMAQVPSPRAFNRQLSESVEQILFKALAKTPQERFSSGALFIEALRQSLENLRFQPGVLTTAELPPLPPGVEPPPPRRLSMQTALDKVQQEMALQAAKGQSLTHLPSNGGGSVPPAPPAPTIPPAIVTPAPAAKTSRGWLPYAAALGIVLVMIAVGAGIVFNPPSGDSQPTPSAPPAVAIDATNTLSASAMPTETTLPATEITLLAAPPTETVIAPTVTVVPPTEIVIAPTATVITPTETLIPPTLTAIPPTETVILPTATVIPPTATPISPTEVVIVPTATLSGPTPAPAGWLPVRFIYNADTFYWMNDSSQSISAESVSFERIDSTQRYTGNRWAYWTMEPGRCLEIRFADVRFPTRPENCRPNAFFTPTRGQQDVLFWTGGGSFRVLWGGQEIAVCSIEAGQCSAFVPGN